MKNSSSRNIKKNHLNYIFVAFIFVMIFFYLLIKQTNIFEQRNIKQYAATYSFKYDQEAIYNMSQGVFPKSSENGMETPVIYQLKNNILHLNVLETAAISEKDKETILQYKVNGMLENLDTKKSDSFNVILDSDLNYLNLNFETSTNIALKSIVTTILLDVFSTSQNESINYPEGEMIVKVEKNNKSDNKSNEFRSFKHADNQIKNDIQISIDGNGSFEYIKNQRLPTKLSITRKSSGKKNQTTLFSSMVSYELSQTEISNQSKNMMVTNDKSKNMQSFKSVKYMVEKSQDEIIDLKITKDHDFADDFNTLSQIPKETDITQINALFSRLSAFLRLNPDYITDVSNAIESANNHVAYLDILSVLLTSNGTDLAQKHLRQNIDNTWDNTIKRKILLNSLAFIKEPNQETEEFSLGLRSKTENDPDTGRQLSAVLGSIAYHSKNEAYKAQVRQEINEHMKDTDASKYSGYIALGNMGYAPLIPEAQTLLQSKTDNERLLGVELLRKIDQASHIESKEMLLNLAESDPNHNIRRTAAEYIDSKTISMEDSKKLAVLIKNEKDITVATTLVSTLGDKKEAHIKELLFDLYDNCGHPKLCQHIRSVLGGQ